MIFIFGIKDLEEKIKKVKFECTGCLEENIDLYEIKKKFELFFLPIFNLKKSYFIKCENCNSIYKVKNERIENILKKSKINYEDIEKIIKEGKM